MIFAVDVGVRDRGRFAGKPVVASGVKRAIDDADAMIAEALRYADDPNAPRVEGAGAGAGAAAAPGGRRRLGHPDPPVLMTGVSYMIPFVAAGGLLIALGFLLGGYEIARPGRRTSSLSNTLFNLPDLQTSSLDHACSTRRLLRLPRRAVLHHRRRGVQRSSSRPWPATSPSRSPTGPASPPASSSGARRRASSAAGFLGGIVGGVLAGFVALWIAAGRCRPGLRGLMPVVVIPLLAIADRPAS